MDNEKCKQCGHCCILLPVVCLTPREVAHGNYNYRKKPLDDDIILKQRLKYIPELKKKIRVCIYYDPKTRNCKIHHRRPSACRKMYCGGSQFYSDHFTSWPPKEGRITYVGDL